MNSNQIIAIVLIVAGILGLAYGGFSYNKETTRAKIGPLELKVTEKQTINVPIIIVKIIFFIKLYVHLIETVIVYFAARSPTFSIMNSRSPSASKV